jgi:hypothetical protein
MIYNNNYYKIHNNRRIIINIQMIENATSEKNGFTNKESGFNAFYFFCCPTTKTVFNKKCGLVVILERTNRVSPAYHLHKWGGLAWLSHSQILNHFESTESQDMGISPKMCGFVSRITTGEFSC